jgi:hypothetical protein
VGLVRDRCLETSTSTGTGDFTLAGAEVGYQTFSAGGVDLNRNLDYCIEAINATTKVPTGEWEVGTGYLTSGTNLIRSTVLSSSNSNALVSFSAGTKYVFIVTSASERQDKGQVYARSNFLAIN